MSSHLFFIFIIRDISRMCLYFKHKYTTFWPRFSLEPFHHNQGDTSPFYRWLLEVQHPRLVLAGSTKTFLATHPRLWRYKGGSAWCGGAVSRVPLEILWSFQGWRRWCPAGGTFTNLGSWSHLRHGTRNRGPCQLTIGLAMAILMLNHWLADLVVIQWLIHVANWDSLLVMVVYTG